MDAVAIDRVTRNGQVTHAADYERIELAKKVFSWDDFDWLLWCDEDLEPPWQGRKLFGAKRSESKWHPVPDLVELIRLSKKQ